MCRNLSLFIVLLTATIASAEEKPLVVHEWGTFTSLQDESGRAIGYLNSSDEPIPSFVHRLQAGLLVNDNPNPFSKSIGAAHPDVTMRLETPVMYFYPGEGKQKPAAIDVSATFRGGVLTEFYPKADVRIEGGYPTSTGLDRIGQRMTGTLTWKSLLTTSGATLPETKEHVWLAPRDVKASDITVGSESERYVFYRGVGQVEAPLQVIRSGESISIYERNVEPGTKWGVMWLAEFRADGACAFRTIGDGPTPAEAKAKANPARFADGDFSKERAKQLRAEMRIALIADGLFEDEADAMLNTWERSYFQGAGQRLFFVVPKAWTDRVLPLTFSRPVEVTRAMIGRIELVTPAQRELLAKLPDAKAYQALGRFGYAMLLDEMRYRLDPGLQMFSREMGIRVYAPTTRPAQAVLPSAVAN